ncbi:MAG: ferrochelatase [Rickettsiaceae bacterium]|nr:MAG: ferrochelatase [Rickettsiaceae bacterium]
MSESFINKKTAVVLFNLGGPDKLESVEPFLFNLFYDPAIIRLANPWRWLVAKLISKLRKRKAQQIYALIGGKSALTEVTESQRLSISQKLNQLAAEGEFEVFVSMRYWSPRIDEVLKQIEDYEPQQIILMPLYPQFSTTTTESSLKEFEQTKTKFPKLKFIPIKTICCYYNNYHFVQSHCLLIKEAIAAMKSDNYRILFSAHGIPTKIISNGGDPYQWQVEQTVDIVVNNLKINNLDYKLSYQSRATPVEWLTPDTEHEIKIACQQGKALILVPIVFVSEHVETLVELDIEYKAIADKAGIIYSRVPALGISDTFINSISNMLISFAKNDHKMICNSEGISCPRKFFACPSNI